MSFEIVSSTYATKFEFESCDICPSDGKLYFNTNRATSTDADYDGLHYILDYVYDPAQGDSTQPGVYRWETANSALQSVTDGGASYNGVVAHSGSISGNTFTDGRYNLSQAVVLNHDRPWIVEWASEGAWDTSSLLFSSYNKSKYEGNTYFFRRMDSTLLAFGQYSGGQYDNYGINLSHYGIDSTEYHVYTLKNRIAADGSNMVYLFVDGVELGALDNYYDAGTNMNTKSNWLSGKDFTFSYIGTDLHPMDACSVDYIQVWGDGAVDFEPAPNIYRWETVDNALTGVDAVGITPNATTQLIGSCSGGVYTDTQVALDKDVVLLHDRPWTLEWKCEGAWTGGSRQFAAGRTSRCVDAPFLYRDEDSGILAFGYYTGSKFNHYGIKLSDHGIDGTASHVYRLQNRIAADGSNMVYLYVDGVELGAMNNHYVGLTSQNTTVDWLNGRDITFSYFSTYQHGYTDVSFDYIQFWEDGIPQEDIPNNYRWETQSNTLTSLSSDGYTENTATMLSGAISGNAYSGYYSVLEDSVVLLHDRSWHIQWKSQGSWKDSQNGALLLSSGYDGNEAGTVYLYRRSNSEIIAFGHRHGKHHNYGIKLSDHGIDGTASHTYLLENRIAADGSNMVYLSVDGVELGAMNGYYIGGVYQNTTDNWISGKDFVFSYLGTGNFTIGNCDLEYLQISEGEIPTGIVEFRDWDGRLISSATYQYGETVAVPANPSRPADAANTYLFAGWDKAVTVCSGDTVYTATYTAEKIPYTVVFKDYNGMQLSSATYYYGDTVTAPVDPSRAADDAYSYTFAGWSPAVTACTGNVVYTATYTAKAHPSITPKYPSLSFEGEIFYNIYFTVTGMEDVPLTDIGLLTWSTPNTDGTIDNAAEVIAGAEVQSNGYYTVHSNGIPAKKLGDLLYFKIYAKLPDGSYIYSGLYNYSAKAYAMDRLANSSNANMKALCVAMLNYGAAAQVNFSYKPYALMNADLTTAQQGLVSAYNSSMIAAVGSASPSKTVKFPYSGFSNRYPSVTFEGAFAISYYFTPSNAPDNGMKLYYWDANTYASVTSLTTANATGVVDMEPNGSAYKGTVEGIAAKEIDKTIYVAGVYTSGGVTYTTGVLPYSLGAYCVDRIANGSANMQAFATATAVYGYYAKQYFGV